MLNIFSSFKIVWKILFFLAVMISFSEVAMAKTVYIDCKNGDDSITSFNGGETFKTINKSLEMLWSDSSGKSYQTYEILVDGNQGCEYGQVAMVGSVANRGLNGTFNTLYLKAKDVNYKYGINGAADSRAFDAGYMDDSNKVIVSNAKISGSRNVGLLVADTYKNLTITDSQLNISSNILFNNEYGLFELSNSSIVINQTRSTPVRFPAYTHHNLIVANSFWNASERMFGSYAAPIKSGLMGINNNQIDINRDLSSGDHLFMAWTGNGEGKINTFDNNIVNYKGPGTLSINVLFHCSGLDGYNLIVRNNKFSGISHATYLNQYGGNIRGRGGVRFINNTFDAGFSVSSYRGCWSYNQRQCGQVDAFNNINLNPDGNNIRKNATSNLNNGFRVVADLNKDGIVTDQERITDQFCTTSGNCNTNQFTISY